MVGIRNPHLVSGREEKEDRKRHEARFTEKATDPPNMIDEAGQNVVRLGQLRGREGGNVTEPRACEMIAMRIGASGFLERAERRQSDKSRTQ